MSAGTGSHHDEPAIVGGLGREQAQQLTLAYQGVLKARRYGLVKLPAIVIKRKAVVYYGVTDLEQALSNYEG